ncbi:MAG: hypothetical protein HYR94_25885 [Chloroflexi bacterium]|nr:hypothetical protein [Chloroflexota bacterium]
MSRQADIQKLIFNYTRQLQKLKEQQALQGVSTPSAILIQIEDIEAELEGLQTLLEQTKNDPEAMSSIDLDRELAQLKTKVKPEKSETNIGSFIIKGNKDSSIKIGNTKIVTKPAGDVVAGDKITIGRDKGVLNTQDTLMAALDEWKRKLEAKIAALADLETYEKDDLKEKASKFDEEAAKGAAANPDKLAWLLNTMSSMAPDILEVTIATLQNPFAGVGLVLRKIDNKIKLERQS